MADGILLKHDHICVPPELYSRTLADLHEDHQGTEKMKLPAQTAVYCARINDDVVDVKKMYPVHKAMQQVQPMLP